MKGDIKRYFLFLSYNGKNYKGWQSQKNGPSVQVELNIALSTLLKEKINVVGCGRTDTGVHAQNFYAHFDSIMLSILEDRIAFVKKLNSFLPMDIAVFNLYPVTDDANARFSAISRTYEYRITRSKNSFLDDFTYYYNGQLQVRLMNEGARIIMKYSDFTSFSKLHTHVATNNCKIMEAIWKEENDLLVFTITADRFLRNMVRAIVGTLLDLGRQKFEFDDLRNIIESKDRSKAGMSVPAKGLFLVKVNYPDSIFI
jgi:tRNA pseudouridine38-40 synthase